MATLLQIYNILYGDDYRPLTNRTISAVLNAANAVINEDPGTANHANRLVWAQAALASREGLSAAADEMFVGVCSNPTIQTTGNDATDNDIQFVVNSLVNSYATGS